MLDNYLKLPSIYGSSKIEEEESGLFREISFKHEVLKLCGRVNTEKLTAILCSNTDGYGRYSEVTHLENLDAGEFYAKTFRGDSLFLSKSRLFKNATSDDLYDVIQDPRFKNIFVIGHSTYHSWRASDMSVDWYDLGKSVKDHLKDGIFVNLGCGGINSWNKIPLGYFVVNNSLNLLGKKAEHISSDELKQLSRLEILNPKLARLYRCN